MRRELSGTYYRLLLRIDNPDAHVFYETEADNVRWWTRELEWQIGSLPFARPALGRDESGVLDLASKGRGITWPSDLVEGPSSSSSPDSARMNGPACPTWNGP